MRVKLKDISVGEDEVSRFLSTAYIKTSGFLVEKLGTIAEIVRESSKNPINRANF